MGSPFKMKPKSQMMKAWKQSPVMQKGTQKAQKETKGKRKFGEVDAETREKQSIGERGSGMQANAGQRKGKIGGVRWKANVGKQAGATDLLQVGKDTYAKAKKYVKGKLGIPKVEENSPVKKKKISEKAAKRKVSKGKGMITSSFGKNPKKSFVKYTKEGRKQAKTTGMVSGKNMKKSTPIKKSGGKSPVMQQDTKKKQTKGKTKLPKLVVNTPRGPKAPRGPQSGKIGGVRVSIQTKGRSTKNTDLLEVGKKYYNKAKKYVKSKMK